jgi:hypothetical protein
VAVFTGFLIFTFFFMRKNREQVDTKEFKQKFGAYVSNVETYKKPRAADYPTVFLIRRLLLALNIVYLRFNLVCQVLFAVHSSLLMLAWLIIFWPFDTNFKNYLECANEFIILMMSYFGFLFTDYVANPVSRYSFGYLYLAIIGTGLLLNIVVMGSTTVMDIVKYLKAKL